MIITVTKKHIRKGKGCDPELCPVALALHGAGFATARVGAHLVRFRDFGTDRPPVFLSFSARRFIAGFDAGRFVKPFRFRFDAIPGD